MLYATSIVTLYLLVAVNLFLTYAIIRKIRSGDTRPPQQNTALALGAAPRDFEFKTLSGSTVDHATSSPGWFGLISTGCSACRTQIPKIVSRALTDPPQYPLNIFIVGEGPEVEEYIESLSQCENITLSTDSSSAVTAFQSNTYPVFYAVDERGKIAAAAHSIDLLPS